MICCKHHLTMVHKIPQSHERAPMSGAPYKSVRDGAGRSFQCFNHKRVPISCLQITGQTIMYNETTSSVKVES